MTASLLNNIPHDIIVNHISPHLLTVDLGRLLGVSKSPLMHDMFRNHQMKLINLCEEYKSDNIPVWCVMYETRNKKDVVFVKFCERESTKMIYSSHFDFKCGKYLKDPIVYEIDDTDSRIAIVIK